MAFQDPIRRVGHFQAMAIPTVLCGVTILAGGQIGFGLWPVFFPPLGGMGVVAPVTIAAPPFGMALAAHLGLPARVPVLTGKSGRMRERQAVAL